MELAFDRIESRALALPNLDGEQLEKMAVVVRRRGAGAFGPVEKPAGDVEANRAGTGRSSRGSISGSHSRCIDEGRDVRGQPARVPWGVARMSAKETNGRISHVEL